MPLSPSAQSFTNSPIPAQAGIGLKFEHIREIIDTLPSIGWFEVHAENYMSDGGPSINALKEIRRNYPVSVHGVGLSIGGTEPLDGDHLNRLKRLVDRFEPGLVSEHLAWCTHEGAFLNDLLPLPYTRSSLANVIGHVNETQDMLGRTILIENPSLYVAYQHCEMTEPGFLNELASQTGCGILLDVNNVFVSASNLGFDPNVYLAEIDMNHVREIHLAGHHVKAVDQHVLRIDDHGSPVCSDVWDLYASVLQRVGPISTLIEWDTSVPSLATLLGEADLAQQHLSQLSTDGGCYGSAA